MDTVTIADKVRFWQEQDRINRALIPRLIKTHELVTGLSGRLDEHTAHHGDLEAKLAGTPDLSGLQGEVRKLRLYAALGIGLSLLSSISALIMALVR